MMERLFGKRRESRPPAAENSYTIEPIGVVHSPFSRKEDAPIQGVFSDDAFGTIEVDPRYEDGLLHIEMFSHLTVLYLFDRVTGVDLQPLPFLDDVRHGVFATRNPRRPNRIGTMVVRLYRREGNLLRVDKLDALDGTPVIDIKPYVQRFDSFPDALEGWFAGKHDRPKPPGRE